MSTNFNTFIEKIYSLKTTLLFLKNCYPDKQSIFQAINNYALSNNFLVKIKDRKFSIFYIAERMSLLTVKDITIAKTILENHAKSCDVQKATSDKVTGVMYELGDDMMISCNVCFSTIIFYDLVLMFLMLLTRVLVFVLVCSLRIRKLRISNINNLKYSATCCNKKSAHGTTELNKTMEAKGYSILHKFNKRNRLTPIFFTDNIMIRRA
ncbi:hypothetical protein PHYBLDRAFT_64436 [Phycomyces blakesleeanus NRRL 1555(-)]|uniref:Uncharacterized protein n=1 Tax=Phycomyces blakesleeanus (strain ATCC 8743b / DSM 1359 / FGSC 10004 / NBRC 33097 / NRRL 1555) TaxID=763407 RepID=A0A162XKZ8_PHYB8|nr:hypothetical protein PHYBLDRAFT_64436 [Phycomyces blakesleeanus NRRL 1555(-)]OAD75525.1 hypothetical protein PHYBLDRAFT_64436 [Phycomyces blakesleeanus NRRL 1555(-)]|eukprot:XP_018293565.1 hypothetical protein PHYBLDRAFT_64436 [Phycomyces blakesleeanus NRRL 1555(-)]